MTTNKHIDVEQIRNSDILFTLAQRETRLRRKSKTSREWCGPCPVPGCACNDDGFIVQPKSSNGPRWFCRGGHHGDLFDFTRLVYGWDFKETLRRFGDAGSDSPESEIDTEKYLQAALRFIADCEKQLWGKLGGEALQWLRNRGLEPKTITTWRLGFNPGNVQDIPEKWGLAKDEVIKLPRGITIPNIDDIGLHSIKIRRLDADGKKYHIVRGGEFWIYGGDTFKDCLSAFLFESELDSLLAWQTTLGTGFASIPAGSKIHPEWNPIFKPVEDVIVCPDNDEAGMKHAGELCNIPHFHKAEPVPNGKDLTDYRQNGGNVLDYLLRQLDLLGKGEL